VLVGAGWCWLVKNLRAGFTGFGCLGDDPGWGLSGQWPGVLGLAG
jgi:hypothetical protein